MRWEICCLLYIPYISQRFVSPSGCCCCFVVPTTTTSRCRYKFACQKRRGKLFLMFRNTKSKVSNGRQVGDRFSLVHPLPTPPVHSPLDYCTCFCVQMLMSLSALQHFYMCPVWNMWRCFSGASRMRSTRVWWFLYTPCTIAQWGIMVIVYCLSR